MTDPTAKPLFATRAGQPVHGADVEPKRFFDPRFKAMSVTVLPGRHYVSSDPGDMIVTLLGSCVAACIRDPVIQVGGLNHFLLPESETGHWGERSAAMRYGNHAMEVLINDIVKRGGDRRRLEFKVFGGANVIEVSSSFPVGQRNVEFVERYLRDEGFAVAARHLGGTLPRRIHYFPTTGQVQMRLLKRTADRTLFTRERDYDREVRAADQAGSIELFQ